MCQEKKKRFIELPRVTDFIPTNVAMVKNQADELYAKQSTKRKALLNAPENQEQLKEFRERRILAETLYKARKEAKLTQAEVAERMKVSQPYIAKLEQGKGSISWKIIVKYATACGKRAAITLF